jgi:hypothetical protein
LAESLVTSTHFPPQATVPAGQAHVPAEQVTPGSHAVAQLPQWVASVCVSTQVAPHAVWPFGQTQTLFVHETPEGQAIPHPPQFAGSEVVSTQLAPPHVGHASEPASTPPPVSPREVIQPLTHPIWLSVR